MGTAGRELYLSGFKSICHTPCYFAHTEQCRVFECNLRVCKCSVLLDFVSFGIPDDWHTVAGLM